MEDGKLKIKAIIVCCLFGLANFQAQAGEANGSSNSNEECPVGQVNNLSLDEEFGYGASDITRCIKKRHAVKLVMQINKFCRDNVPNIDCTRPYGLAQLESMYNDYTITHGMTPGIDFEMVAVVHDSGGLQMLDKPSNQFASNVEELMGKGVKFYFCQNTVRGLMKKGAIPAGQAVEAIIPGVEFVTGGLTALADFQSQGYQYIQP